MRTGLSIRASKSPPWPKDKTRATRLRSTDSKRPKGRPFSQVNDEVIRLQSLQNNCFRFANSLPLVNMMERTIITMETARIAGAYVGGSVKLEVSPDGGVAAGKRHRSIPAREDIIDTKKDEL